MITHQAFGQLRLAQFVDGRADVAQLRDWEFMEDLWVGEALGFSEFLRLEEDPEVVRSIALDCGSLPAATASTILAALDLPLRPGMSAAEVIAQLGPPSRVEQYVADRASYEFSVEEGDQYAVSCTVHSSAGLVYVVVMAPTPRRLSAEEV